MSHRIPARDEYGIAVYYACEVPIAHISAIFGVSRAGIHRVIKRLEVDADRAVRAKRTTCKRGHDLAVYGEQKYTKSGVKNGRDCAACRVSPDRRERNAKASRERYHREKAQTDAG